MSLLSAGGVAWSSSPHTTSVGFTMLGEPCRLILPLAPQLLADPAHVAGERADSLPGVGRPLVDLVAEVALRLLRAFRGFLLGLLGRRAGPVGRSR